MRRAAAEVAADGGYASQDNLTAAKARGVTDVAFHKKRGLAVEDMVKSRWVYRKLRNFRAGIEAGISVKRFLRPSPLLQGEDGSTKLCAITADQM